MDSLANYASDGENSENSEETKMSYPGRGNAPNRRASDANYDPVQMDMSEESNNNNSSEESSSEHAGSPMAGRVRPVLRADAPRPYHSSSDQRRTEHENHSANVRDDHHRDRPDRPRYSDDKSRRSSHGDRKRDSDHRDSRDVKRSRDEDRRWSRDEERRSRDEDRRREGRSAGSCKEDKTEDRERGEKDHHHREDNRREKDRDRGDRDKRRDRNRDRRHSRDERPKERHREERSIYHKDKDRTRSRSRSRSKDHGPPPFRTMSYREEKGRNKLAQLEKLGIELKAPEGEPIVQTTQGEQHFYNPLATASQGKYAEQIQKRKLLWANKSKPDEAKAAPGAATASTWVGTTFTHDQDGKVTAKFKRLMGIKGDLPTPPPAGTKPDILKKQEEMFNNMEQQYEVARATTHTQRGVGLGYATGGYQFPR